MTQTSSIHIDSCRSDGRCPECGGPGWIINSPTRGMVAVWQMPCGCAPCSNWACIAKHLRALLTEAIRQRDERGSRDFRHERSPHMLITKVMCEERDAALRDVEEWKAKFLKASSEADVAEQERDEARAEGKTQRLLVEAQTEQISRSAMDLYAAVQSEVAAEERAEKAEALLRDCLYPLTDRGYPTEELVTKIKGFVE